MCTPPDIIEVSKITIINLMPEELKKVYNSV